MRLQYVAALELSVAVGRPQRKMPQKVHVGILGGVPNERELVNKIVNSAYSGDLGCGGTTVRRESGKKINDDVSLLARPLGVTSSTQPKTGIPVLDRRAADGT